MSSSIVKCLFAAAVLLAGPMSLRAATLQIEPVLIDVAAPGAASTVSLRNDGTTPINVQIRVFRWSQIDGKENPEPTEDVVAVPAVTLAPNSNYVARIVRDQASRRRRGKLSRPDRSASRVAPEAHQRGQLLVRYSIPVFSVHPNAAIRPWHGRWRSAATRSRSPHATTAIDACASPRSTSATARERPSRSARGRGLCARQVDRRLDGSGRWLCA